MHVASRTLPVLALAASLTSLLPGPAVALSGSGSLQLTAGPGTTLTTRDDGTTTAWSDAGIIDVTQSFAGLVQSPTITRRVDRGEIADLTIEIGVERQKPRQQPLMTMVLMGINRSKFDGRFLQARDLASDQARVVSVEWPFAVTHEYVLRRGGVAVGTFRSSDGVAPFLVDAAFDSDRAAIVSDGESESALLTLSRAAATSLATLEDGRRLEFDTLEIRIPLDDPATSAHEVGHSLSIHHERVTGAYEMTLSSTN
jgi:hypothetical protein